jgi:hypothetical protein
MKRLYCEINVWQPIDDQTLIRYRCIHVLPDNKYAVKASDYVRDLLEKENLKVQDQYFLESMFYGGLEMLVEISCDSLQEAIDKHNKEFQIPNC